MRRLVCLVMLIALFLPLAVAPTQAAITDNPIVAAHAALDWLRAEQLANGSLPGFSAGDSAFDPIFAFVSAGIDPRTVAQPGGATLFAYAEANAAAYAAKSTGAAAKALLGAVAAGADPRNFGGTNLVATVMAAYSPATGLYGSGLFEHSFALLALASAGESVPTAAITALVDLQQADGGWEYGMGFGTDTNTTALAIQALVALDVPSNSAVFTNARAFLRAAQNDDGGFGYDASSSTDANSTGYVLQAIAALGDEPSTDWATSGGNPLTALLDQQNASGGFRSPFTGEDDNLLATVQAVPGLLLETFPLQLHRVALPLVING